MNIDLYFRQFLSTYDSSFTNSGWEADVYTGPFDHSDLQGIEDMVTEIESLNQEGKWLAEVKPWWTDMKKFAMEKTLFENWTQFNNEENFPVVLSDFLFSLEGSIYRKDFKFEKSLNCNHPAPPIKVNKLKGL